MTISAKQAIKQEIVNCLKTEAEIKKIVLFGSFLYAEEPNDIDLAILVESSEGYLPLGMKYYRLKRGVSDKMPLDILPMFRMPSDYFGDEINKGEVLYERA